MIGPRFGVLGREGAAEELEEGLDEDGDELVEHLLCNTEPRVLLAPRVPRLEQSIIKIEKKNMIFT